jgi:hypothetical protein
MHSLTHLPLLISGVTVGMIMMQVVIVAPAIFKSLNLKDAGPILRIIFPRLFSTVLVLAVASFLISLFFGNGEKEPMIAAAITTVTMAICYAIVPATNAAKDSKNEKIFKKLHTSSVLLTLVALISNLGWSFL